MNSFLRFIIVEKINDVVANDDADYLSLSRALIIDPLFPRKIQEGSLQCASIVTSSYTLLFSSLYVVTMVTEWEKKRCIQCGHIPVRLMHMPVAPVPNIIKSG